jgi:hypothetical protein
MCRPTPPHPPVSPPRIMFKKHIHGTMRNTNCARSTIQKPRTLQKPEHILRLFKTFGTKFKHTQHTHTLTTTFQTQLIQIHHGNLSKSASSRGTPGYTPRFTAEETICEHALGTSEYTPGYTVAPSSTQRGIQRGIPEATMHPAGIPQRGIEDKQAFLNARRRNIYLFGGGANKNALDQPALTQDLQSSILDPNRDVRRISCMSQIHEPCV